MTAFSDCRLSERRLNDCKNVFPAKNIFPQFFPVNVNQQKRWLHFNHLTIYQAHLMQKPLVFPTNAVHVPLWCNNRDCDQVDQRSTQAHEEKYIYTAEALISSHGCAAYVKPANIPHKLTKNFSCSSTYTAETMISSQGKCRNMYLCAIMRISWCCIHLTYKALYIHADMYMCTIPAGSYSDVK